MTLREALRTIDLGKVYVFLNKQDTDEKTTPTLEQTKLNYSRVVKELLHKPRVKAYKMSLSVMIQTDWFDKQPYIHVCLRNHHYATPPKNKQPWGGERGQKMPKGKYNCNLSKYNEYFSFMGIKWSQIIDTPIENDAQCSMEEAVAHILWELTFGGWTENAVVAHTKELLGRIEVAADEIHDKKCITIPPSKKGGITIVIPNSVNKQIADIINKSVSKRKSISKCKTCLGYGLWACGTASPMGPMDASDGMPTLACPECGANPNPKK